MREIKCPHCGKEFSLEEENYVSIVNQVHNEEFERIIDEYKNVLMLGKKHEIEIAIREAKEEFDKNEQHYKSTIDELNKEVQMYKDFKMRLNTKMIGESLEQHCANEFAQISSLFPNASFEKDNITVENSKGDFIYREQKDGIEFISIMFEMKNEEDVKGSKKKNSDHFDKLNKDRNNKNCEYAVLVSMLEKDSERYNAGIVEASMEYPKMYVVRPQCFIPIILLLRDAALNAFEYKREIEELRSQTIELNNFENNLNKFKDDFSKSVSFANDRFQDAINGINAVIEELEDIRDNLTKSGDRLNTANGKLERINIKKLAKGAPTVLARLEEIRTEHEKTDEEGRI